MGVVEINELNTISCLGLKKVAELYVEPRPIAILYQLKDSVMVLKEMTPQMVFLHLIHQL